jgi:flagellar M-ring protein FliF
MNAVLQDLKKLWSELKWNQKVSLLFASLATLLAVALLLLWSSKPQMQLLYGRLEPKEMAEVIACLDQMAVPYKVEGAGSAIFIASEKVYAVRMQLASKGIPNSGGVGFEIFDQTNFGVSDFVQRTNYTRAIQGELARTVMQVKGVRSARVMIVVPENKLLAEANKTPPTASVFVDTGGTRLTDEAVNSIRFLIANSVEGLQIDEVAVVDNQGRVLSEHLKGDKMLGAASGQMKYRQALEEYYNKKLETMLGHVVGFGNVVARVSIEIDGDTVKFFEEKFDPEGQVVRTQNTSEDISSNKDSSTGQVVGLQGQGGGNREGAGATKTSEESKKNKSVSYEINRSTLERVQMPGNVRRMSAAVFLAKEYAMQGNQKIEQDRDEAEIKKIKQMVANALGVTADRLDQISVEEVEFHAPDAHGAVGQSALPWPWMEIIKSGIALIVGVVTMLAFFRAIKRYQAEAASRKWDGEGGVSSGHLSDAFSHQALTPEVLNAMIKQKSDNVGTALKSWANVNELKP